MRAGHFAVPYLVVQATKQRKSLSSLHRYVVFRALPVLGIAWRPRPVFLGPVLTRQLIHLCAVLHERC